MVIYQKMLCSFTTDQDILHIYCFNIQFICVHNVVDIKPFQAYMALLPNVCFGRTTNYICHNFLRKRTVKS